MAGKTQSLNRRQVLSHFAAYLIGTAVGGQFWKDNKVISMDDVLLAWPEGPVGSLEELAERYIEDWRFDWQQGGFLVSFSAADLRADAATAVSAVLESCDS